MTRYILEGVLQVIFIIPFAILLMKKRTKDDYLRIFFFGFIYIFYQIVLVLPRFFDTLNLIDSRWNWDGKIYGIIFGVICYLIFRKYFSENNYFTFRQNSENIKISSIAAILIVILATTIAALTGNSEFNIQRLAFQLTMPGIDEEIMFRGIFLGLLMSTLKEKIAFLGNPSVLLTAMLFGSMHALTLDKDFSIEFEPILFLQTGFGGYVWGWITIKSKSILLAVLSHNFSNFFAAFSTMFK